MDTWKRFDPCKLYNGLYWLSGRYTDYEVDVDDEGRSVGCPVGESTYLALVFIKPPQDGTDFADFDIHPVDDMLGKWSDEYGVEWVMPCTTPALPFDLVAWDEKQKEVAPPLPKEEQRVVKLAIWLNCFHCNEAIAPNIDVCVVEPAQSDLFNKRVDYIHADCKRAWQIANPTQGTGSPMVAGRFIAWSQMTSRPTAWSCGVSANRKSGGLCLTT